MRPATWKTLAIVFMILFVIETALLIWLWTLGSKELTNESKCSEECGFDPKAGFYQYSDGKCYCIDKNGDVVRKVDL